MLSGLSIRDVVIIERLDLSFADGLSVLTGETGAGKSILLDALGLAVGERSDSGLIRVGADKATVTATFEIDDAHPVRALLSERDIDVDGPLVLRRTLGRDGRSRAFINDQPTSVGLMREVGGALVEVHGQFDQRGLLDPVTHRAILDAFGGLETQADAAAAAYATWQDAEATLTEARRAAQQAASDEEFLRHSLDELEALGPQPGEEQTLANTRAALMNRQKLIDALAAAQAEVVDRIDVEDALRRAQSSLQRAADGTGPALASVIEAFERAALETAEAIRALEATGRAVEQDPASLDDIEERLFALRGLARKHRVEVDQLAELCEGIRLKLGMLDDRAGAILRLEQAAAEARRTFVETAEALSARRSTAAQKLDAAVAAELPPLKLDRAALRTRIERLDEASWGPAGLDRVAFEVATNPGTPPGPLKKVASGGELSRIMLALKVVLRRAGEIPTLIFDEVDSGIGGATAAAVGERLDRLARDVQVLVVTHSPQVAARGAQHWRVAKSEAGGTVATDVDHLSGGARREEIARMLSGAAITDEARAAADQLIHGTAA